MVEGHCSKLSDMGSSICYTLYTGLPLLICVTQLIINMLANKLARCWLAALLNETSNNIRRRMSTNIYTCNRNHSLASYSFPYGEQTKTNSETHSPAKQPLAGSSYFAVSEVKTRLRAKTMHYIPCNGATTPNRPGNRLCAKIVYLGIRYGISKLSSVSGGRRAGRGKETAEPMEKNAQTKTERIDTIGFGIKNSPFAERAGTSVRTTRERNHLPQERNKNVAHTHTHKDCMHIVRQQRQWMEMSNDVLHRAIAPRCCCWSNKTGIKILSPTRYSRSKWETWRTGKPSVVATGKAIKFQRTQFPTHRFHRCWKARRSDVPNRFVIIEGKEIPSTTTYRHTHTHRHTGVGEEREEPIPGDRIAQIRSPVLSFVVQQGHARKGGRSGWRLDRARNSDANHSAKRKEPKHTHTRTQIQADRKRFTQPPCVCVCVFP